MPQRLGIGAILIVEFLVLYPGNDHQVRAAEGASVQASLNADSNYMIDAQGKYRIEYMNLCKVNVKTGDIIKKGQIIGETLFIKDAPDAGRLLMRIDIKEKYIADTNFLISRKMFEIRFNL